MTYYIDTSALVKIYHQETGAATMLAIYESQDEITISELTRIECLSTLCRKYREHEISSDILDAVIARFERDLEQRYTVARFSSLVLDEAWKILRQKGETRGIKTLDSLQFAFFKTYCTLETQFVCSDVTLSDIVKCEGFQLLIPVDDV